MVEEITLHNKTLNTYIKLNRTNGAYFLDDDSPDWGTVQANQYSYPRLSSRIGAGLTNISAYTPRIINIIGWVINDTAGTIEQKKGVLNTFCNIFDELEILAGDYKITGYFGNSVIYPSESKNNNDCKCKFMIQVNCLQPMFEKGEISSSNATSELTQSWVFPWVLQENAFVFGTQQKYNYSILKNAGSVETGFTMEVSTSSNITGLYFTLGTQQFKLKGNYVLTPSTKLTISTVEGNKGIWKEVSGVKTKAFETLDLTSDFIQIPVGTSRLEFGCQSGSLSALDVKISFKPLYYLMEDA